ncbi:alginate lyase family protein [Salinibacter ruber]|uniref:alginate lyase family protein n=1 Tax=Salinibacter ruber TaxID=146919 RepID=UPI000E574F4F|nr:alginate lyase family protein [Salinibacter ruber]
MDDAKRDRCSSESSSRYSFSAPLAILFTVGLLVGTFLSSHAQEPTRADTTARWKQMTTVRAVCRAYPSDVKDLLNALNLRKPGLEAVRKAVERDRVAEAAQKLLVYYRAAETAKWLRTYTPTDTSRGFYYARQMLDDTYRFYEETGTVPRTKDDGLDWTYRGPAGDVEWAKALNRHFPIRRLLEAYLYTEKDTFAHRLDRNLRDWIVHSRPYPGEDASTPVWGELAVSFRVEVWSEVFFALQDDDLLRPGTRLLMLMSLQDHAHYLKNFHSGGNLATMELSSLALLAAAWPEFSSSDDWMTYATQILGEELKRQVYPDGVHQELSASYHLLALSNFEQLIDIRQKAEELIPKTYEDKLVRMYEYLAWVMRPNGRNPLNNDSDLKDLRDLVREAAERYDEPQWAYIATRGEEGRRPKGLLSRVFPWAGQVISRNGWHEGAHWSFFDIGPWGTAHQHNDKLHLSVHAFGRDLLVDAGRFAYQGEVAHRFREEYARHSRGHNVVMIDGQGQGAGVQKRDRSLGQHQYMVRERFDYARGRVDFDDVEGKAVHRRVVLYVRDEAWIVLDRIVTDRPRTVETYWHFHPECAVALSGSSIATTDEGEGNLRLRAASPGWDVELVEGQDEPYPQGWYSKEYSRFVEATVAIARQEIDGTATFAWLIAPGKGNVAPASIQLNEATERQANVRIQVGEKVWRATIPITGKTSPQLVSVPQR